MTGPLSVVVRRFFDAIPLSKKTCSPKWVKARVNVCATCSSQFREYQSLSQSGSDRGRIQYFNFHNHTNS